MVWSMGRDYLIFKKAQDDRLQGFCLNTSVQAQIPLLPGLPSGLGLRGPAPPAMGTIATIAAAPTVLKARLDSRLRRVQRVQEHRGAQLTQGSS